MSFLKFSEGWTRWYITIFSLCILFYCSFYNWETQTSTSNPTPNYQVIAENATGLLFKNKRDRKPLDVDPKVYSLYCLTPSTIKTDTCYYTNSCLMVIYPDWWWYIASIELLLVTTIMGRGSQLLKYYIHTQLLIFFYLKMV